MSIGNHSTYVIIIPESDTAWVGPDARRTVQFQTAEAAHAYAMKILHLPEYRIIRIAA